MDNKRLGRISQEIRKVVSHAISFEISDPKVDKLTSVTDVKVSSDLSYADIFVSVMGTNWEKGQTIEGLTNSTGFIKKSLARDLKLRQIPELRFHIDNSIEHGIYMDDLIAKTVEKDRENAHNRGDAEPGENSNLEDEEIDF